MPRLDLHVREVIGRDRPVFCSPLGYTPEMIEGEKPLPPSFLGAIFPENKVVIGYAGSMGITNALEPLMKSIECLSAREDIHFVLVGAGDLRDKYIARMKGLSNVTFISRIEKDYIPSFLRRCDALYLSTHPSAVWRFGQSMNKMLDYMIAGKPIIASYSGYRSMINEADSGLFVEAGDIDALVKAIVRTAEMPAKARQEMGERGRQWVLAKRSYAALGEEYLVAIEKIKKRGNSASAGLDSTVG
jgi:glycosyltransferase involved in cell wall biosynthesis